jgi:S1-C subfamily serine protease
LLDSAGRLIGINTAIYSPSGTSVGVGFAVPVDTINRVVPQLIAQGQITRPYLGVRSSDRISQQLTRQMNVQGLLVLEVEADSPAAKAGLRPTVPSPDGIVPGDVIQEADGRKILAADHLYAALERHKAGEQIELKIWRNGSQEAVKIPLDPPKD